MPQRKEEADEHRLFAILHQLASDVVDGRDMVGIERVAQAEGVGEGAGSQEQREMAEGDEGDAPDDEIGDEERN